jgi:hypothetical protein
MHVRQNSIHVSTAYLGVGTPFFIKGNKMKRSLSLLQEILESGVDVFKRWISFDSFGHRISEFWEPGANRLGCNFSNTPTTVVSMWRSKEYRPTCFLGYCEAWPFVICDIFKSWETTSLTSVNTYFTIEYHLLDENTTDCVGDKQD